MLLWLLRASLHCIKSPPSLGGISAYMQDEGRDAKSERYICPIFSPGGSNCLYYHARIVTRIVRYQHHTLTTAQCVLVESRVLLLLLLANVMKYLLQNILQSIFLLQYYLFQKSIRNLVSMFPCLHNSTWMQWSMYIGINCLFHQNSDQHCEHKGNKQTDFGVQSSK